MLIPMFSFRDKAEKLYTIPLPFMGTRDADSRLKEIYGNPDDIFYQAVIVAEFNPETGEIFPVGQDVSYEFNFDVTYDKSESEDSYEESPVEETESEEIP